MTELDFLPEWYFVRQERRRSYVSFVWLGLCLLGVMGVWFYLANSQIRRCQADLDHLGSEQSKVNEQLVQGDKLRTIRAERLHRAQLADQLIHCPDAIHVVRKFIDLMPDEVALVGLDVTTEAIKAAAPGAPAAASGVGRGGVGPAAKPQGPDRHRYILHITAMAPVDEIIGNFENRLSRSDLFTRVEMGYSRDVQRLGRLMRQFELTCQIVDDWEATDAGSPLGDAPAAVAAGVRPCDGEADQPNDADAKE